MKRHPKAPAVKRRGSRVDFTAMRLNTTTEKGTIKVCTSIITTEDNGNKITGKCNRKGAARWNKTLNCYFITHKAMLRPSGKLETIEYCIGTVK